MEKAEASHAASNGQLLCAETQMGFAQDKASDNYRRLQNTPHQEIFSFLKKKNSSTQFTIKICKGICLKNVLIIKNFRGFMGVRWEKQARNRKELKK